MNVNFYATLRQIVGAKTVEIPIEEQATLQQLVDEIITRYPALSHELLDGHVHVIINGRDSRFLEDGLSIALEPDDTISVFPAVGGGIKAEG